jgi:hypothetical protein
MIIFTSFIRMGKALVWGTFPIAKIVGWLAALCPKHQSIEQPPKRNKRENTQNLLEEPT